MRSKLLICSCWRNQGYDRDYEHAPVAQWIEDELGARPILLHHNSPLPDKTHSRRIFKFTTRL